MKAIVVIKDSKTEIVLTPENGFEIEVIERIIKDKYEIVESKATTDVAYQEHSNHRITIEISREKACETNH